MLHEQALTAASLTLKSVRALLADGTFATLTHPSLTCYRHSRIADEAGRLCLPRSIFIAQDGEKIREKMEEFTRVMMQQPLDARWFNFLSALRVIL